MQGKTCSNFKAAHPQAFAELAQLARACGVSAG
jgi:hypothetical protein